MPDKAFIGKTAIISGGSRGIGRAIAHKLAGEGATVVLVARDQNRLETTAAEIKQQGGRAEFIAADLREVQRPAKVIAETAERFGGIDILVNNAGAAGRGDFLVLTEEQWADGFALKFFGAVRLSRAAWPYLKERSGAVLNVIGVGGRTPGADFTIAGSVNGAFLSFTKALAQLGIRDRVQVNAINPGPVRTDRFEALLQSLAADLGGNIDAAKAQLEKRSDIVRIGEPEDIANLAAFVLSAQGSLLQGALIDIDGGSTKTI